MLEQKIKKLREKGLSYKEISQKLQCSIGTVCYHLGKEQKQKHSARQRKNRLSRHPFYTKITTFCLTINRQKPKKPESKLNQLLEWKIKKFHMKTKTQTLKDGKKYSYETPSFTLDELKAKIGDNPKCYLTGKEIDIYDTRSYEFDHILPRSRGGDNSLDNLGLCTKEANRAKSNMTPEEFVLFCKLVLENNGHKVN